MINHWTNDFCTCEQSALAVLPESVDCLSLPRHSQITGVIMMPLGAALPTDWASAESFLERLDNTDTTGAKGKYFLGIGSLAPATDVLVPLGRNHNHIALRKWSLNFAPQIGYSSQYAFLQSLQRSRRNFRLWFATLGGRLIGGANGIRPEFITANVNYQGGAEDVETASIIVHWSACTEAPRSNAADEIFNLGLPGSYSIESGSVMGNIKIISQEYYDQSTNVLTFTENGGTIPADSVVGIYRDGQRLFPLEYVRTGNVVTISSTTHYEGANYQIVIVTLE